VPASPRQEYSSNRRKLHPNTDIRLFSYSKKEACYYCGKLPNDKAPSSKEHVPPKMMFKGFNCDSITIPACANHNTNKNIGDRAVVCIFCSNPASDSDSKWPLILVENGHFSAGARIFKK